MIPAETKITDHVAPIGGRIAPGERREIPFPPHADETWTCRVIGRVSWSPRDKPTSDRERWAGRYVLLENHTPYHQPFVVTFLSPKAEQARESVGFGVSAARDLYQAGKNFLGALFGGRKG